MPSPIGHALAGVAAGCLMAKPVGRRSDDVSPGRRLRGTLQERRLLGFAGLGVAADIDFLFGIHSAYTHSLGATVVVAAAVGWCVGRHRADLALAAFAAYGSHPLLDWLGSDTVPPLGIMALWPASSEYYLSDRQWFWSVCRQYRELDCWMHNAVGTLREIAILGPSVVLAFWVRCRGDARGHDNLG